MESLLHAPSWNLSRPYAVGVGGLLTPSAAICPVSRREGSVLKARDENRVVLGRWGVSLTRPVLVCVSSRVGAKFLLHAQSWNLCVRSALSFRRWGVSLTRPVLETVWSFVG